MGEPMSRVIFTGDGHYQLFWGSRGYSLKSGDASPALPLHECMRLMKMGIFAADDGTWNEILKSRKQDGNKAIDGMLKGQRCFIIAGGPSAKGFDMSRLDNEFTIAVNHTYEFYPKAKALIFVDTWFAREQAEREKILAFQGMVFASFRCAEFLPRDRKNIYIFPQNNTQPSETLARGLYSGRLSALAALNLAIIMGADEIYLIGYDMKYSPDGSHHWYGTAHPSQDKYPEDSLQKKLPMFDNFAPWRDRIYNCSKDSAIKTFKKVDIEQILGTRHAIRVKESVKNMVAAQGRGASRIPEYQPSATEKLSRVNGMLKGKRVFVVGSGPSLKGFDFKRLANEETIAVNHTLEFFPDAKYHLFGDPRVLGFVQNIYKNYKGMIFASHHANLGEWERTNDRVHVFAKRADSIGERLEDGLYSDFNSGMEAVNLALVMGADKVYLLGMDFCANNGEYYFYGKPSWLKTPVEKCDKLLDDRNVHWGKFEKYRDKIFNCSPISRIETFQKVNIDEVLNGKSN